MWAATRLKMLRRSNRHRASRTRTAHRPATSCLGASPTPPNEQGVGTVMAVSEKPAQLLTWIGFETGLLRSYDTDAS